MAWAALSFIGIFWPPLHASPDAILLFAGGIGCLANWLRNRTLHCCITAPLFLAGGALFLLAGMDILHFNSGMVWGLLAIATCFAFLLEWRYARRAAR